MIVRQANRPRPIPFSAPHLAGAPHAPSSPVSPVHWGSTPGRALVLPAQTPRELYAVTRQWQGQAPERSAAPQPGRAPERAQAAPTRHATSGVSAATPATLSVRYTGQGALCVRSSVTGRHYRFQGHGHTLKVDKHDQLLLSRIADLELT